MQTTKSKDGTTLAYDVLGSGPALIYITGASCFRTFKPVRKDATTFAEEFTVFTYDRRGRGDSGDTPPYSIEREVDDVEAMIDAAGGRASLYGHSSGAVLALEAALRLGGKVTRVVMYDPAYVHDDAEKDSYRRLSRDVHALLADGRNKRAMKTFLRGIGMPRVFVWLLPLLPGWRTMVALAPTLAYDIALTRDLPPVGRAAHVAVPTQLVVGERSPAGMHDVAGRLATAIPGAELLALPGQNHLVSPKAVLPVLSRFLKS